MTIKSFDELNKFEKMGLMKWLRDNGYSFAQSTDIKTGRTRPVWCKDKISFDEETISVEID